MMDSPQHDPGHLLETLPVGVIEIDGSGGFLRLAHANAEARRMLGADGAGGALPGPDALHAAAEALLSGAAGGEAVLALALPGGAVEARIRRMGSARRLVAALTPQAAGGEAASATRRAPAPDDPDPAAQAAQRLERFFELSADLMAIAARVEGGRLLKLNAAWSRLTGAPVEALLEQGFHAFVHPDDLEPTKAALAEGIESAPADPFRSRWRGADGTWRTLEWRGTRGEGRLYYLSARDVTEREAAETDRRRRETELTRMQGRFEAVFENSDALMMIKRRSGTYIAANRRFLQDVGAASLADVSGLTTPDPREIAELWADDEQVFATGRPFVGEERFTTPDGVRRTYLIPTARRPDSAGLFRRLRC